MQRVAATYIVMLAIVSGASAAAHHSLGNHDTTTPVRVKGKILQIQRVNPHSFIFLEETDAKGGRQRWAVEGPGAFQLARSGVPEDFLKPGEVIEVCGYVLKEKTIWQMPSASPGGSISGQLITAEVMVMPDGRDRNWGDYGVHRCFPDGFRDQHSK
jgi:hypothetical protein